MEPEHWHSLSALNRSPTIWRGLTLGELVVCLGGSGLIGFILSIPIAMTFSNLVVIPLVLLSAILLLFYPFTWLLGKHKAKHGPKMYMIRMRKILQRLGLIDFGFEIDKKAWATRSSKNKW